MRSALASLALVLALAPAPGARAQTEHTVRAGQSLARIARRYHVSVPSLAGANGLGRDAALREGQVIQIPEQGTHYVAPGETLTSIAHDHQCSADELAQLNRLRAGRPLRIGQRLVLPGHEAQQTRQRTEARWGRPRSPGVATLYRGTLDRRFRLRLVDERGRARRPALNRMRELMQTGAGRARRLGPRPAPRLIEMLARISDHFGGRTITVVSGYRAAGGNTRESSRHVRGHALDIRIQGVPNEALRDFVRDTFRNVGVGYYPRSRFVHVDVRDRAIYWVDWSRPGERPLYQRRGEAPPEDATHAEIRRAGMGGDDVGDEGGEGAATAAEDRGRSNPDAAEIVEEPEPTADEAPPAPP